MNDNTTAKPISELEIKRSVHWAMVEILLGSVGHGLKIPFTGQFLSLYQLNVLANGINKDRLPRSSSMEISGIVGVLKTLSPAGNRIGPMFSIMIQGFLFWLGTLVGGINLIGQIIGGVLLSLWAFMQPLATFLLIFGFDLFRMIEHYNDVLKKDYPYAQSFIYYFLIAIISIKVLLACLVVCNSYFRKQEWQLQTSGLNNLMPKPHALHRPAWKKALSDLLNPLFLVSFVLMFAFALQIGESLGTAGLLSFRSLAIAFVLFYIVRSPYTQKVFERWAAKSKTFNAFYLKALKVLASIDEQRKKSD